MAERVDVLGADVVAEPGTVVLALLGRAALHGGDWQELKGTATVCAAAKMKKKMILSLSLGSGKEGAQVRGEKGANGLLGTPAPHLNPTMDRGEGIRCAQDPPSSIFKGTLRLPKPNRRGVNPQRILRTGAEGASWRDPGLRPSPVI